MISVVTAQCALKWFDASGSASETRMHTLSSRSVSEIAGALQSYRAVALGISGCAITGQEISYAQIETGPDSIAPDVAATKAKSLVLVFATADTNVFFTVVLPSPKVALFTPDVIPTIDITHAAIQAFSSAVVGMYASPDGFVATELIAAVYSEEF